MYVGILTAPFGRDSLEQVAAFAGEYGFGGLEIVAGPGGNHIDLSTFDQAAADKLKELMERRALLVSSGGAYTNKTDAAPAKRAADKETVKKAGGAAAVLRGGDVCTLGGQPR